MKKRGLGLSVILLFLTHLSNALEGTSKTPPESGVGGITLLLGVIVIILIIVMLKNYRVHWGGSKGVKK